MSNFLLAMLVGVFSSLAAALVYLALLLRIRPRLEISDHVAISKSKYEEKEYQVKVINRSRFPVVDIRARLFVVSPSEEIREHHRVQLKIDELLVLEGYSSVPHPEPGEERYAWRFLTFEDLQDESRWGDGRTEWLLFQVSARHSISGFGEVFEKRFYMRDLKEGEFAYGASLKLS